jgi:hypothetical protein
LNTVLGNVSGCWIEFDFVDKLYAGWCGGFVWTGLNQNQKIEIN